MKLCLGKISESESNKIHLGKIGERIAATVPAIGRPKDNQRDDYYDAFTFDDCDEEGGLPCLDNQIIKGDCDEVGRGNHFDIILKC